MHIEASTAALRIMVRPMSTLMANLRAVEAEPGASSSGGQQHQEYVSSKVARQQLLRSGTWRARLQQRTPAALEDLMASISPAAATAQDEAASRTPAAAEGSAADASTVSLPWYIRYTRWKPTSKAEAAAAEHTLLGLCRSPLDVRDVPVGPGRQQYMHTITAGSEDSPPMVLLPGYGAGAGFYFRNLDGLAQHFRLHAVDLLGTGMSGRPPFAARTRESAEGFFIDALARWRDALGLGKVILVGHSLGGYLAASYALAHPEHVQHLVLVCPAGVPQEVEPRPLPAWARNPWSMRGQLFRLSRSLWELGATPGILIRSLGAVGWQCGALRAVLC